MPMMRSLVKLRATNFSARARVVVPRAMTPRHMPWILAALMSSKAGRELSRNALLVCLIMPTCFKLRTHKRQTEAYKQRTASTHLVLDAMLERIVSGKDSIGLRARTVFARKPHQTSRECKHALPLSIRPAYTRMDDGSKPYTKDRALPTNGLTWFTASISTHGLCVADANFAKFGQAVLNIAFQMCSKVCCWVQDGLLIIKLPNCTLLLLCQFYKNIQ